jgi:hypothetical protein
MSKHLSQLETNGITPQNERSNGSRSFFDGKRLIGDCLFIDGIIYAVIAFQYIFVPLRANLLPFDFLLLGTLLPIVSILNLLGAKYYQNFAMSLLNSFLLFISFGAFCYLSLMYSGPYNTLMLILCLLMLFLNAAALVINLRAQFVGNFGNVIIMLLCALIIIVYIAATYMSFLDRLVLIFPAIMFLIYLIPWLKKAQQLKFHPIRIWQRLFKKQFYCPTDWKANRTKKISAILCISTLGIVLIAGASLGWGYTIRIKADDNFQTLSSYWGPPALQLKEHTSTIITGNNDVLDITNDSLAIDPAGFVPGSFAYVINVSLPADPVNYGNYSAGARSYPNGTIFLSESLPSLINVNVTFKYVVNHIALKYLNISQSTLIMNYHGDFIYHDNIFDRIDKTYLMQLLDYWEIKFYLDIHNWIEFPHVFNYLDSIPIGYDTLNWAHGKWAMFQGISYDFEPGSYGVPPGRPGGKNLTIGPLIGNDSTWARFQKNWYKYNEQDRELFKLATVEYEKLYTYGSNLGYRTYITLGLGEIYDTLDGDIDYTRCPIDPISPNKDVLYGHMLYQDNNFDTGRYEVYKGCTDQMRILPDQGKTILLGWLAKGTRYYTDDAVGLERYIYDCKIAQAAGMEEIFHAPIYRMQTKWGDEAILALHEALNNDPKEEIIISVPPGVFNTDILADCVENINYAWLFYPLICLIVVKISLFGTFRFQKGK